MKNRMAGFHTKGIFSKITIVSVLVIILFSSTSCVVLLQRFSVNIQAKDQILIQETAKEIYLFTQEKYNTAYSQQTAMHTSLDIASIISNTRAAPSEIYTLDNLSRLDDYLTALTAMDGSIQEAIIFTSDGASVFSHSSQSKRRVSMGYAYTTLPYIETFAESMSNITVISDDAPPYLSATSSGLGLETISFISKIYDVHHPVGTNTVGYLMINYSRTDYTESFRELEAVSDGLYFVLNEEDQIIYSNDESRINTTFDWGWADSQDILLNRPISLSGVRVVGIASKEILQDQLNHSILQMALIALLSIGCMICVIVILNQFYARKFQRLADAMHNIGQGKLSMQLPVESNDEFGHLAMAFNAMGSQLDTYIKRTYLAETQRRTAELYALQAQINPHFLVNTIESIRMYALEQGYYEISEMLKKLGNLFQSMVQFDSDIIYMEDELEYISSYLDLQNFRYQQRIQVELDCPAHIYNLGIPRFTLQPLIENALFYGMHGCDSLWIRIGCSTEGQTLILEVRDNGPGIEAATLERLNAHIHNQQDYREFGIALRNVHTRICLLFGKEYGLHVESVYHQGTVVTARLPAMKKTEMESYVSTSDC